MARLAAIIVCTLLSGCSTIFFSPSRSARFVDEDGTFLYVDYATDRKPHVTKFVTAQGIEMEYKSGYKVRVTKPSGGRFVAYQHISPRGNLFLTDDGKWEYYEEGTYCILAELSEDGEGYETRFEGVVCAKIHEPLDPRGRRVK